MQAVLHSPAPRRSPVGRSGGATWPILLSRGGLKRAVPAAAIALAIGQAVEAGGDAHPGGRDAGDRAGRGLGSRYGAVQSVIHQAPTFGLARAADVAQFIEPARERPPPRWGTSAVPALAAQALLTRVRAQVGFTEDAGTDAAGAALRCGRTHTLQDTSRPSRRRSPAPGPLQLVEPAPVPEPGGPRRHPNDPLA